MFAGHLAVALATKRATPRAPLAALVAAAFGLDLLWPVLLLAGVEQVRIVPGYTAFTPLVFESYPWSHSLSMGFIWAIIAGRVSAMVLNAPVVVSFVARTFRHGPARESINIACTPQK